MASAFTDGRIDVDALVRSVASDEHGAICTFVGTARRRSEGREVRQLRYEAYLPMAEAAVAEIVAAARARWPQVEIAARHRLGDCPLGEASVAVVAAAPHRDEAFAACRYVIDAVKAQAPIWKQEVFADGTAWVGDPESFRAGGAR